MSGWSVAETPVQNDSTHGGLTTELPRTTKRSNFVTRQPSVHFDASNKRRASWIGTA
jgi:hypothetical protein